MRRYGKYAKEEQDLNGYVEVTLKDDERNDPLITKDALILLNILTEEEYEELVKMTYTISNIIKEELSKNELDLYDIKLEFGRLENDSKIVLIDEVSGGNMRVYKNGEYVEPMQLAKLMKI